MSEDRDPLIFGDDEPWRQKVCETCRFWSLFRTGDMTEHGWAVGGCHRLPPAPSGDIQHFGENDGCSWPNTFDIDWCGEWKPIRE